MKLQYIADDISDILVDFYMTIRHIDNLPVSKIQVMKLHVKQAIIETIQLMYGDFADVYDICVYHKPMRIHHILGYDVDYDRNIVQQMIDSIKQELKQTLDILNATTICNDDEIINIHVSPFDGFGITKCDIIGLLDVDCL